MTGNPRSNTLDMLGRTSAVPLDEALRLIGDKNASSTPETGPVSLGKGMDRITSETISASENIPTHPRSIMDGYAVRAADTFGASDNLPAYLEVKGEVAMERYDIIIPKPLLKDPKIITRLETIRTDNEFRETVGGLGGYHLAESDSIVYEQ